MMAQCRVCQNTSFKEVVDLGMTPLADDFLTPGRLEEPEMYYPLKVVVCTHCQLVQLTNVVSRELLYSDDYPYTSNMTVTGQRHYEDMAHHIAALVPHIPGELAVDIGSNVGVLANGFKQMGFKALGVEPVAKIARMANLRGVETISEFFSFDLARQIKESRGQARFVTGTNVVAHIDNLWDLFIGVRELLAPKGVFVFEAPYIRDLISNLEYDTIYHEHLSYLGVRPIEELCERTFLQLFYVEKLKIHGGTLRYYIARKGDFAVDEGVHLYRSVEERELDDELKGFADRVDSHRLTLQGMLIDLKRQGRSIAAVSAPAKGMTLLNYCRIGNDILDYATEKSPMKIGRFTPGTHIPVVEDDRLLHDQPDFALLLAWNFAEEIMKNLSGYKGNFIIPVPGPKVVFREA